MTDELKKRMARLRELAPRLNSATDQASRLVAMVEKFLVEELHIGISAESTEFNSWSTGKDEDDNERMVLPDSGLWPGRRRLPNPRRGGDGHRGRRGPPARVDR